jgi:hypothetical protein
VSAGPPAWIDPVLEELVASLVVSRPAGALATGGSLALATASQEAEASLVDTRSLAKTAQGMMDSPPWLSMQGQPLVTPPRERQPTSWMPMRAQRGPMLSL